ncbi:MAG: hypothetical protein ACMXYK_03825 [Candidatus Woesearchaeota archaeon]
MNIKKLTGIAGIVAAGLVGCTEQNNTQKNVPQQPNPIVASIENITDNSEYEAKVSEEPEEVIESYRINERSTIERRGDTYIRSEQIGNVLMQYISNPDSYVIQRDGETLVEQTGHQALVAYITKQRTFSIAQQAEIERQAMGVIENLSEQLMQENNPYDEIFNQAIEDAHRTDRFRIE